MKELFAGKTIKSNNLDINLEVIVIDKDLEQCVCTELNSHDGKLYYVKFNEIMGC